MIIDFSVHKFENLDTAGFDVNYYSKLKFGLVDSAYVMGTELANAFWSKHSDILISDECVVIPSPYNYIENAATTMTRHFFNRINQLLVNACGKHLEYDTIRRKVSYTADYGFLTKDKRKGLLDNDEFYLNNKFLNGKTLIFIDDVKITGTHEEKLRDILSREILNEDLELNNVMFLYYAEYIGDRAEIESELNFHLFNSNGVSPQSYVNEMNLIIRPIKYIMALSSEEFNIFKEQASITKLFELYNACLAEGYYKIPIYQDNFNKLNDIFYKESQ